MRVGHIVSLFPVASETFVADALLACQERGQEVFVWSLRPPRPEIIHPYTHSLFQHLAYPIHPLMPRFWLRVAQMAARRPGVLLRALTTITTTCATRPGALARNLYALLRACQIAHEAEAAGATALYAHFANSPATAAWVAASLLGVPFGLHAHGFDLESHPRLLKHVAAAAQLCVVVSESGRRYLSEHVSPEIAERFQLVRCGVEIPTTIHPRDAGFRILSVGRLRRGKGFRTLLSALSHLAREGIEFECRIVGEGPLRQELHALAEREGIAARVAWLGSLPRPRVLEEMARAHVLALPLVPVRGEREGLPVVVLEAMAQGAAVVSTPLYGISEVICDRETGLLVPPRDAAALANALHTLAKNPELRARMADHARRLAAGKFDRARTYPYLAQMIGAMPTAGSPDRQP